LKLSAQHTLECVKNVTTAKKDACTGGRFEKVLIIFTFNLLFQLLPDPRLSGDMPKNRKELSQKHHTLSIMKTPLDSVSLELLKTLVPKLTIGRGCL
jgi:hypothetical protein